MAQSQETAISLRCNETIARSQMAGEKDPNCSYYKVDVSSV